MTIAGTDIAAQTQPPTAAEAERREAGGRGPGQRAGRPHRRPDDPVPGRRPDAAAAGLRRRRHLAAAPPSILPSSCCTAPCATPTPISTAWSKRRARGRRPRTHPGDRPAVPGPAGRGRRRRRPPAAAGPAALVARRLEGRGGCGGAGRTRPRRRQFLRRAGRRAAPSGRPRPLPRVAPGGGGRALRRGPGAGPLRRRQPRRRRPRRGRRRRALGRRQPLLLISISTAAGRAPTAKASPSPRPTAPASIATSTGWNGRLRISPARRRPTSSAASSPATSGGRSAARTATRATASSTAPAPPPSRDRTAGAAARPTSPTCSSWPNRPRSRTASPWSRGSATDNRAMFGLAAGRAALFGERGR